MIERRACEACGRPVIIVPVGATVPAWCDFHAWTAQQEQATRVRSGALPPPEAYQEVRLDETWR
jgi:hypothetical protein